MKASLIPGWLARRRGARRVHTTFLETSLAHATWDRTRRAAWRWGVFGLAFGVLAALVAFAPAAWLARAVAQATEGRVLLADARGTVWNGSALPVLTGGEGSRDAAALPDRLHWRMQPQGLGLRLLFRQACCMQGELPVILRPGLGRFTLELPATQGSALRWPSAWLGGLGTPWNTVQLGGDLHLVSHGLKAEWVQGRLRLMGRADLQLQGTSSRLTTLPVLGSYNFTLSGDAAQQGAPQLQMTTLDGALQLSGQGQWQGGKLRFRGQAQAAPGAEGALNNLLNIIGRRQGALTVISIG
jgi:general secretion pathway protein N